MNNKLWVWGYVPDKVPGMMPFVNQETWCSLETAGSYLRADNAVYMNSTSDMNSLNDTLYEGFQTSCLRASARQIRGNGKSGQQIFPDSSECDGSNH